MSPQRKECLDFILANAKCEVVLVRPDNLDKYVLPDQPIHPAYQYLSETHKADYLRTYFMHFLGGGYTDIKKFEGDWNKAFDDINAREDIFLTDIMKNLKMMLRGVSGQRDSGNNSLQIVPTLSALKQSLLPNGIRVWLRYLIVNLSNLKNILQRTNRQPLIIAQDTLLSGLKS